MELFEEQLYTLNSFSLNSEGLAV